MVDNSGSGNVSATLGDCFVTRPVDGTGLILSASAVASANTALGGVNTSVTNGAIILNITNGLIVSVDTTNFYAWRLPGLLYWYKADSLESARRFRRRFLARL